MTLADGGIQPPVSSNLIIVPDGLVTEGKGSFSPHPALGFVSSRLRRASKQWMEVPALASIEWYAALLGVDQGAARLLADALGNAIPPDARQCWLLSPFAGRLGRDRVHIMPDELFGWDKADAKWLMELLQPMLAEDGFTLLVRDACILAVSSSLWDAHPASFAKLTGHVLPDRHPEGADGGRLMRLCAEMQMLLASQPSERRRTAGLPDVMGVWLWASSELPAYPLNRSPLRSSDALVRACSDDTKAALPVTIMNATQIEAQIECEKLPRYWLLAGDGKAVLLDARSFPRLSRNPWRLKSPGSFMDLIRQLSRTSGIGSGLA